MNRPKLPATAVAVSLALLAPGQRGVAQSASDVDLRLEAGAAMASRAGASHLGGFAIGPSVRYSGHRIAVSAKGSAWLYDDQWHLSNAFAALEVYTPLLYGVRAEVVANASRLSYDPTMQNDQLDASGRIHYMRHRGGVWLGSGVAHPLKVSAVSNVNVSSGGVWTRLHTTTLRGSVTSFFFTKVVDTVSSSLDNAVVPTCAAASVPAPEVTGALAAIAEASSACRRESRVTDLEGSVHWEHSLLELTVRGGQRFGDRMDVTPDSRHWASAQTAIWITNQIAAVAGGGREPAQPARGLPARSYGSLGLMLAYWPIPRGMVPVATPASHIRAFELRPAGTALQRLTARIGGVETVEVMGDFSDWAPIPLARRGRDLWELLIPLNPGVHHINMRIDGGPWIAPPGVPAINDGFSGEVGVLVIKP